MRRDQLVPPQPPKPTYTAGQPDFAVPFMIAESTRMFLNFLAVDSALPNAHRNVIAEFLHSHNQVLTEYMLATYGVDGAYHANLIAQAMSQQFLQHIADDRDVKEAELFQILEQQIGQGDADADD